MADQLTGKLHGDGLGALARELPTDRLREEAQNLLSAFGERALSTLVDKVEGVTGRLTDYAHDGAGGGPGLKAALATGRALLQGKSPLKSLVSAGLSGVGEGLGQIKEKTVDALTGAGRGGGGDKNKKIKVTNIVEDIDVGVPVRVAYDQWTQFEDFPTFMKKVEDVSTASETELDWKAQVFWSHRQWHSTVVEQVPDERIVWRSKAEKGHVDGAVTFHSLTPDLTRILLVLQYYPQGFFERTGNIWRAQGRRARLELKHFRRHVMTQTVLDPEAVEGWRGEVHDGEVTRSDEDVREEEAQGAQGEGEPQRPRAEDREAEYPEEEEGAYDDEEQENEYGPEEGEEGEESDEDYDDGDYDDGDYDEDYDEAEDNGKPGGQGTRSRAKGG